MARKISSGLYDVARTIGRLASKINDVETFLSGDPKKIVKRAVNKKIAKVSYGISRKLRIK